MTSNYHLTTVIPNVDIAPGTVFDDGDIVFNWTPFEIPTGTAALVNITIQQFGRDGVASALNEDMHLYFAKSINGVAPTTLGNVHANPDDAAATACRRNIIGSTFIDRSSMTDLGSLVSFNILSNTNTAANVSEGGITTILQGDPTYSSTTGYQTIWVAGAGNQTGTGGEWLFDTSIASNEADSANVAANMTGASVALVTSGTDPRKVFAPGDIAIGSTGGPTMEVVSVDSATAMTVKNISEQLDNAEIINPRNPFTFIFGFKY